MLSLSTVALEAYQRNASWDPKFWVVLLIPPWARAISDAMAEPNPV